MVVSPTSADRTSHSSLQVRPHPLRVLVVAGTASGVGKTTVTLGLLEAYRRRGLAVQAFKVGPDFIDPGFHALVTGRPSYNLDGWMCGREHVIGLVARHAADADVAIVEGVMGCFDGADGLSEDGSTAQVAKWLGAPVVLVVDAKAQSRSAAAAVLGFELFDPELHIAGVIFNRVAGDTHARWLREAVAARCGAVPLGAVKRDDRLLMPERHLGLVTAAEGVLTAERRAQLAELIESSIDLNQLLALARPLSHSEGGFAPLPMPPPRVDCAGKAGARKRVRIGIAKDVAFQFYYPDNLELLRAAGAELVFWSPLADGAPPDVDGLYFGGGYPEIHARALAANVDVRKGVRAFAEAGKPIYAECGGLMYLAEAIEDFDGVTHPMVGVLPSIVRMKPRRLTLGYTEIALRGEAPLGRAGETARGHEFHYSSLDPVPASVARVYRTQRRRGGEAAEGYLVGQTLMSYIHLHFASNPAIARRFVDTCAGTRCS